MSDALFNGCKEEHTCQPTPEVGQEEAKLIFDTDLRSAGFALPSL
jgi:hypothetical protein